MSAAHRADIGDVTGMELTELPGAYPVILLEKPGKCVHAFESAFFRHLRNAHIGMHQIVDRDADMDGVLQF